MSAQSGIGEPVALPRVVRPETPTMAQTLRRRNALWLFASEIGLFDPATNRVRPHAASELAKLWNCSTRLVQTSIVGARVLRERAQCPR
jgi:hypothetical protein